MNLLRRIFSSGVPSATRREQIFSNQQEFENEMQYLYLNGYLEHKLPESEHLERLNRVLKELAEKQPRAGFTWEEKYEKTLDLRPNVYQYDNAFLDILFENNIPQLLKNWTGKDLCLMHVQLRKAFAGDSYMDWHRDTNFTGGILNGNIPPVYKIIYYPYFDEGDRVRLRVIPGSHHRFFYDTDEDLERNLEFETAEVRTGNDKFLFFDTSLLHAVTPTPEKESSFRLIFIFCHEFQLQAMPGAADLQQVYLERLKAKG